MVEEDSGKDGCMNNSYPYYSKYREETVIQERDKFLQSEHEVHQENGIDITKDVILDLVIALETCRTVNEFLAVI